MSNKRICVTGASGFLGGALVRHLTALHGVSVRACSREIDSLSCLDVEVIKSPDIKAIVDWESVVRNVDVIVHTAAITHMNPEAPIDHLAELHNVNTEGTLNLAKQAANAGVKRFIFISSIKVNGECSVLGKSFTYKDINAPQDSYAQSKAEAEAGLMKLSIETGLEIVIIRPPLVYGPNVKGNFAALIRLAKKNLLLPLGAVHNKRSMIALENLIDLIVNCIDHPEAAGQIFLASDDHDLSTTELFRMLAVAAGKRPRLLPVPVSLMRFAAMLVGKRAIADRLFGSLQVDISHTKNTLGWAPPISVEEGVRRCIVSSLSGADTIQNSDQ